MAPHKRPEPNSTWISSASTSKRLFGDLPKDVGASCAEFLRIREQCVLKNVSKYVERCVLLSLQRERQRGVLVQRTHADSDTSAESPPLIVSPTACMYLVKRLVAICPRIQSFWIRTEQVETQKWCEQPLMFEAPDKNLKEATTGIDVRALVFARHLTTLSILASPRYRTTFAQFQEPNMEHNFRPLRSYFPKLKNLSVRIENRLPMHGDSSKMNFMQQVRALWHRVPNVNVTIELHWWTPRHLNVVKSWCDVHYLEMAQTNAFYTPPPKNSLRVDVPALLPDNVQHFVLRLRRIDPKLCSKFSNLLWGEFIMDFITSVKEKCPKLEVDKAKLRSEAVTAGQRAYIDEVIPFRATRTTQATST